MSEENQIEYQSPRGLQGIHPASAGDSTTHCRGVSRIDRPAHLFTFELEPKVRDEPRERRTDWPGEVRVKQHQKHATNATNIQSFET